MLFRISVWIDSYLGEIANIFEVLLPSAVEI